MKVTLSTLFLLISFFVNQLNAQAPSSTVTDSKPIICGFDHAHDQLLENNEELKQQEKAMEEATPFFEENLKMFAPLGFVRGLTEDQIAAAAFDLHAKSGIPDALIYIQVTRGPKPRRPTGRR